MSENNVYSKDRSGDYARLSVPKHLRKSSVNIFVTTAGWVICLSTMFTGGILVVGSSFKEAMAAAVLGMLILTAFAAPLAAIGGRFGVSTVMLTRQSFGKIGSGIFGVIVSLMLGVGWFAAQGAFFALTMSELLPDTIFSNLLVGSLIGGAFMTLSAMFGYKGISILSFLAVPLIVILSLFGGIAAIEQTGGWMALMGHVPSGDPMTLFQGVTIVVGNAAVGAVVLSDLTRYSKSAKIGAGAASMGFMIGAVFCIIAGAAMAVAANVPGIGTTPNLPRVMTALGLGIGALVILILAQWTTNTANVYSASLGLGSFLPIKQRYIVLVLGTIGTLMAVFNVYNYFMPFLNFLGTALPPIAGVMLADYYIITRKVLKTDYHFGPGSVFSQINLLAIGCVLLGAFIAKNINFFTPSFTSIIISFCLYSLVAAICIKAKVPYTIGKYVEEEKEV